MSKRELQSLEKLCAKIAGMIDGRDELIRSAAESGHSHADIATAAGLTRQRVWQIVTHRPAS